MPTVTLNEEERSLLLNTPLNSFADKDVADVFYRLKLIIKEETGSVQIPGEMWDQLCDFAFCSDNIKLKRLILLIFSRTLGRNLDLGFFDEK